MINSLFTIGKTGRKRKVTFKYILPLLISLFLMTAYSLSQSSDQNFNNILLRQPNETTSSVKGSSDGKLYKVVDVVDGDTIKVSELGTIRLIGIDTPETVDPRKPVQCYGIEASNKAKELLKNQSIYLEFDDSQQRTDRYGRTLAYVRRIDGLFYNLEMIKQGYAHEYTYSTPYKYQSDFKNAQKSAQNSQLGLWGSVCNYNKE